MEIDVNDKVDPKKLVLVPVDKIKPNPKNRNKHSEEQINGLIDLIKYQGFRDPLIISNRSQLLVVGHGRLEAAKKLGMKLLPVIYQDFESAEQEYSFGVSHNGIASWAQLDLSGIELDLKDLPDLDIDLLGLKNFKVDLSEKLSLESDANQSEDSKEEEADSIPDKIEPRVKLNDSFKIGSHELYNGDCLEVLKKLSDNSIDSLITDPPAGISFMNKDWDDDKGGSKEWIKWLSDVMKEVLRVMKPGAHGFVWALPRTSHWTASALEDAGFEIRDIIVHLFGSGFPKSLDISKAIDKSEHVEREIIGKTMLPDRANGKGKWNPKVKGSGFDSEKYWGQTDITSPTTQAAKNGMVGAHL